MLNSRATNLVEPRARAAFTLMEVLLVLAILAVAAAMVMPSFQGMLNDQKLTDTGDIIRGKCAVARTHAINDGVAYRFAVAVNNERWRVAPDSDDYWSSSGNPSADAYIEEGELPKGIVFVDRSKGSGPAPTGGTTELSDYTRLMTCYSDGTVQVYGTDGAPTDYLEMPIQLNGRGPTLILKMRGLTGAIKSEWGQGN